MSMANSGHRALSSHQEMTASLWKQVGFATIIIASIIDLCFPSTPESLVTGSFFKPDTQLLNQEWL
jgi:hypothetical protein